jgi:hypothetical protein
MRKVAGGEASAVPHTTFVGHSARQASTNPMILKQGMDKVPTLEETGAFDAPPEEGAEGPLEGSELERAFLKDLTKCLGRCQELTDELSRQGFSSGEMLDGKISQLQQEIKSLMEGGGGKTPMERIERTPLANFPVAKLPWSAQSRSGEGPI